MDNIYYVYEWIRLDTNEPFYVGKGKENRCYKLTRGNNQHFNNIVKSIPCAVNILHNNLDEQTAFGLECYYIWLYKDIIGYDLVNINDGGEGQSLCGETHPMYGKHHSEETKDRISVSHIGKSLSKETKIKISNSISGENHPMYGKHHTEESKIKNSMSHLGKNKGENHYLYGKHRTEEVKKKMKENHADFNGKNNPNAKSVICITTNKIFRTTKEGAIYYNVDSTSITKCLKNKRKSAGQYKGKKLVWRYLIWKHNKKYRVKEED